MILTILSIALPKNGAIRKNIVIGTELMKAIVLGRRKSSFKVIKPK